MSAEAKLHQTVYAALNASYVALGVTGVFDFAPRDQAYPYITIGPGTAIPFDTCTDNGQESTVFVHTWSQYNGQKEVKEIMDRVYLVLQNASLAIPGHDTILCQFEFAEIMKDPDGVTHHGVQRFRVITEEY